ncbi:MAG TPA: DEAD/DEAH box helicase [Clostridia bacterium]|nr:DEAD/DEAH box helicase [Clostridia bacterium]
MKNNFSDLGIIPPILKALEEMGFEKPTDVQAKAIPHVLNSEDVIVMSKTGSGKTAVFGVSMLQMIDPAAPGPQGLILTPARELAVQVDSDIKKMARHLKLRTTAVYGQHNINEEIKALSSNASIVTGTPGRVFDHISHGNMQTKHIRFLVLDEADRMLDMGFLDQVIRIIRTIPKNRITMLFSATMPPEIRRICREYMNHPETIEIVSPTKTVDSIQQKYYRVENNEKNMWLKRLLLADRPESCMIFCNTRLGVNRVQTFLSRNGLVCHALHGEIPQGKRLKTIQQFKQGEFSLLAATDVAARGIHIEGLSLVINYDVPNDKDNYIHRIGRTGRAGNDGRAITLVTGDDIMTLYEIEEHIGTLIPEAQLPAESEFNLRNPDARNWLQENSPKSCPPRSAGNSNHRTEQRKTPQSQPQHNIKHKSPAKMNTVDKRRTRPAFENEKAKSSRSISQTVPSYTTDNSLKSPKPSIEKVQNNITENRMPFFQRLFRRILGKK